MYKILFNYHAEDGKKVSKCNLCGKDGIPRTTGTTSSMESHLKKDHSEIWKKLIECENNTLKYEMAQKILLESKDVSYKIQSDCCRLYEKSSDNLFKLFNILYGYIVGSIPIKKLEIEEVRNSIIENDKQISLPCYSTLYKYSKIIIDLMVDNISTNIFVLKNDVSMTCDEYKSDEDISYLAITAHFISNFRRHDIVLKCQQLEDKTAKTLKKVVMETKEKYVGKDSSIYLTTDTCSTNISAFGDYVGESWKYLEFIFKEDREIKWLGCSCHKTQLIERLLLNLLNICNFNMKDFKNKIKDLICYYYFPNNKKRMKKMLKEKIAQQKNGENTNEKSLLKNQYFKKIGDTRFDTYYLSIEKIVELWDLIIEDEKKPINIFDFSKNSNDYKMLQLILKIFKPFHEITICMEKKFQQ